MRKKFKEIQIIKRSFGCILFEITELRKAFDDVNMLKIMQAIESGEIPKINQPHLNEILTKLDDFE